MGALGGRAYSQFLLTSGDVIGSNSYLMSPLRRVIDQGQAASRLQVRALRSNAAAVVGNSIISIIGIAIISEAPPG